MEIPNNKHTAYQDFIQSIKAQNEALQKLIQQFDTETNTHYQNTDDNAEVENGDSNSDTEDTRNRIIDNNN